MQNLDSKLEEKIKLFSLSDQFLELKKLIREILVRNRTLEKENVKLREMLGTKVEPETVQRLEEQIRVLKEREELVKKKIKRLAVKLEKLELLDKDLDEEEEEPKDI